MTKKQTKNRILKKPGANLFSFYKKLDRIQKTALVFAGFFLFVLAFTYAGSLFYNLKHKNEPLQIGATFIPDYARYFGLDPKETMDALTGDLGIKRFRLVSYWKTVENVKGTYDFSELDWQFEKANKAGAKISLAVGLRQPRWPECHEPVWAKGRPISEWRNDLYKYMEAVINRYKSNPALESYQLENEYFMNVFGECTDFSRDRLVYEADMVKRLDPNHKLIVSRSNNWGGVPLGKPTPDQFGVSVYKRVWDKTATHRYFEYPYPAWFYGSLAGYGEMLTGKDMIIHELQTEAWLPDGYEMNDINSITEQNKSLDAKRLANRIQYGADSGIRTMDLWGVEWWYWRKVKANDPSLWNSARTKITELQNSN